MTENRLSEYCLCALALLGLAGCGPEPNMKMREQTARPSYTNVESNNRVEVTRIGVFQDDLAYYDKRGIYLIRDTETGVEFIGVSGIGITEIGRHSCGKNIDLVAMKSAIADSEVQRWLGAMGALSLIPLKRPPVSEEQRVMDKEIADKHYRVVGMIQGLREAAKGVYVMPCDTASAALLDAIRLLIQKAEVSAWEYAERQTAAVGKKGEHK